MPVIKVGRIHYWTAARGESPAASTTGVHEREGSLVIEFAGDELTPAVDGGGGVEGEVDASSRGRSGRRGGVDASGR